MEAFVLLRGGGSLLFSTEDTSAFKNYTTFKSMFKGCLTCLLKQQGCLNPETCERLMCHISASGSLVLLTSATPAFES
jgi:hypothetical protein